jgi:tRNA nucleotidyltransferase/poly(A) polymerase
MVRGPIDTSPERLRQHATAIEAPIREALLRLHDAGHEAWLAGGCVRDLLLGRVPDDFDVATSARPEAVQTLFARTIPTGLQHGTVTVLLDAVTHEKIEVTTYRGEGPYSDGRRPEHVEFITDLVQDLARRDFTINAMAFDPIACELRDPFDGVGDLVRGIVRCVGSAHERFSEDGLRPLRAVRFSSVLRFQLEEGTRAAIPATVDTFRKVAAERVREELSKLLVRSPSPSAGLTLLADTGLLAEIVPELLSLRGVTQNQWHEWDVWGHTLQVVDATPPDLTVRLAALLHDLGKPHSAVLNEVGEHSFQWHEITGATLAMPILERLRFPAKVIESVVHLIREHNWHYEETWGPGAVRRALKRVGVESLPMFFALREADIRGRGRGIEEGLRNLAQLRSRFDAEVAERNALHLKDLALGGDDLMRELALPPGRWLGQTLNALLERVLDEPALNTKESLLAVAVELNRPR